MFYAHIREDGTKQTVQAHLRGTAALCAFFASKFGEEERGRLLGLAHDIGKNSDEFQRRLVGGAKVDHATAGALECCKIGEADLAGCVAGHHGGLPDFGNFRTDTTGTGTLAGRVKKGQAGQIPSYHLEEPLPIPTEKTDFQDGYSRSLWTRMLYSCLVDADYLDTAAFMSPSQQADVYDSLPTLFARLQDHIEPWFPPKTELNRYRCEVLHSCMEAAKLPRGIYSLTVPTGGGKTVASLAFALKHAIENGLDRVIYVIPYTSIIEQNAAVFRQILGEKNVVEHHSGIQLDEEILECGLRRHLATENWDAPVIVTTAVQFFESLYANRPSHCRKLHNIANSVVIFDEAQMLPACHLSPCVGAIANLTAHFRSTALLCTATQPVLEDLITDFCPELTVREICPNASELHEKFRRVTYRAGGKLTQEELCAALCEQEQVLCIVNTRKAAQEILLRLPSEGRFHLSTLMYPDHRRSVLEEVRRRLHSGETCRLVSTSLIEAGVDVDFPAVYRELAGLDSVVQAAGRCNREGKRSVRESVITWFEGDTPPPLLQKINIGAAREALASGGNPEEPETMTRYFKCWRSLIGDQTDKSGAVESLRKGYRGALLPFETVAQNFHFIDRATCTVFIPLEEGEALCLAIVQGYAGKKEYRKAGRYAVDVYEQHFRALVNAGDIQVLDRDSGILKNLSLYAPETGLSMQADTGKAEFI